MGPSLLEKIGIPEIDCVLALQMELRSYLKFPDAASISVLTPPYAQGLQRQADLSRESLRAKVEVPGAHKQ